MNRETDFLSSFLYGEESPLSKHEGITVSLCLAHKTAGWASKPHGGFPWDSSRISLSD